MPHPTVAGPIRPLRGLATATLVLLAVSGGLAVAGVATQLSLRSRTDGIISGGPRRLTLAKVSDLSDTERIANNVEQWLLVAVVVTGIVFVLWFYRLVKNLAVAGRWRGGSIGMAAGGWFIPVANFVIPVQYVNQAWKASDDGTGRGSGPIAVWWTFWVAAGALRFVASGIDPRRDDINLLNFFAKLDDYKNARTVSAVAFGLLVLAAILAIVVVEQLTRRTEAVTA